MNVSVVISGLMTGGVYAIVGLGLSLVFGVMRLVNLAYGELIVLGAYAAALVTGAIGIDPFLSLVIVVPVMALIAYPLQRFLFTGLLRRGIEPPLVASFGVSLTISALLTQAFGGTTQSLSVGYAEVGVNLLGTRVRLIDLIGLGIGVVLVVGTHLVLSRSRWGSALAAASSDPATAGTMGINVNTVYALTFAASAAVAAVSGVLIGTAYSYAPELGHQLHAHRFHRRCAGWRRQCNGSPVGRARARCGAEHRRRRAGRRVPRFRRIRRVHHRPRSEAHNRRTPGPGLCPARSGFPGRGQTMRALFAATRPAAGVRSLIILALLVAGLSLAGPAIGAYQVTVVTTLLLYVAAATAWNIVGGVAGQFTLATSALIGVGSYASVMLLRGSSTIPVWVSLLGAAAVGGIVAAIIGLILFRLRGFYFTIGTLAVALAALTWMTTWAFTGATTGISAPLADIPDTNTLYALAITIAAIALFASALVIYSPFGLRLMAVRDDEDVAASLGVSPFRSKMVAICLSGTLTGAVGGLIAIQKASIEPFSAFSLDWSITIVVMVIVGGIGTMWGPTIGAVLIYYGITVQLQNYPAISSILSGILMVAVIVFVPNGLTGGARALLLALLRRARTNPSSAPADPNLTPVPDDATT